MLPTLFVIVTFLVLYWFPIRRWMNQWGATPSDVARAMAGDGLLADHTYSGTTAVTVNARPEHIWPWLVQIGYQRGGLYSYDWLDRLFGYLDRPSACARRASKRPRLISVLPHEIAALRTGPILWRPRSWCSTA